MIEGARGAKTPLGHTHSGENNTIYVVWQGSITYINYFPTPFGKGGRKSGAHKCIAAGRSALSHYDRDRGGHFIETRGVQSEIGLM